MKMLNFKDSGLKLLPAFGICVALLIGMSGCGGGSTPEVSAPSTSPEAAASAEKSPAAMTTQKIDVNKAPIAELDKLELPGTKPSLSERIQGARPYKTADDLVAKKAISQDELNLIKNLITLGEGK